MITDEQLAALDQAERAATPGPWVKQTHALVSGHQDAKNDLVFDASTNPYPPKIHDLNFIALSRNSMRELLDEVVHLRKCMNNDKPAGLEQYILKVSENAKLRAELVAARDAMANVMDMLDKGILVRDISLDAKPVRMISLVQQLKEFSDTIKRIDDTLGDK